MLKNGKKSYTLSNKLFLYLWWTSSFFRGCTKNKSSYQKIRFYISLNDFLGFDNDFYYQQYMDLTIVEKIEYCILYRIL